MHGTKTSVMSVDASSPPITAFRLEADVLTRQGAQTNETEVDYRYLAPDCIRFLLPNRLETGRFGPGREDYWLKDKEEIVVLAGRDYVQDRRQVDEMLALARNYVALSDPGRLNLRRLELASAAPKDLPASLQAAGKKLTWISVASSDFALVRRDGEPAPKDLRGVGGLIVLGGPMAVYEADHHPFLKGELALVERALTAGRPVLGICLGAQMIASVLGAYTCVLP